MKREENNNSVGSSEIKLQLESYESIFSDFDARPYSQRALSDDFLHEMKKASKDKPRENIHLRFLVPKKFHSLQSEILIKKRLREHFLKHYFMSIDEVRSLKRRGIIMALSGVIMIFIATYLFSLKSESWIITFLQVLLEPAGWFTAWTGLEDIYYTGRELKKNLDFYEKMSKSEISFIES